MTLDCSIVRERIADGETVAGEIAAHLAGCEGCRAVAASLVEIDLGIEALPRIDASDALVRATLDRVERERATAAVVEGQAPIALVTTAKKIEMEKRAGVAGDEVGVGPIFGLAVAALASALGALVMAPLALVRWIVGLRWASDARGRAWSTAAVGSLLACVVFLTTWRQFGATVKSKVQGADAMVSGLPTDAPPPPPQLAFLPEPEEASIEIDGDGYRPRDVTRSLEAGSLEAGGESIDDLVAGDQQQLDDGVVARELAALGYIGEGQPTPGATGAGTFETAVLDETLANERQIAQDQQDLGGRDLDEERDRWEDVDGVPEIVNGLDDDGRFAWRTESAQSERERSELDPAETPPAIAGQERAWHRGAEQVPGHAAPAGADRTGELRGETRASADVGDLGDDLAQRAQAGEDLRRGSRVTTETTTAASTTTRAPIASTWWPERQATTGLALHPRDGWWSNTYVPGDPALRVLHQRLADARDVRLGAMSPLALAESASPATPALAAPIDRAIALGVHADVAAVEGPSRVRIEVALRGIEQAAGRRGPMRIGVVIDARRELSDDEEARVRAVLASLARARSPRDRAIVTAAGAHGGTLVPLGTLRHGEVEVALRRVLSPSAGDDAASAPIALETALGSALEAVASPDQVGLVLLLTPDAAHDRAVDGALHAGALAGVTTSAVSIGSSTSLRDLDAIALAGHGRRRVITSEDDATAAIRAELEAASRLVARAIRVRVRLAPGVELVDVIGGTPLDAEQTARTRQAEQAIDRALMARLGIESDRDEDDDGIRIMVPSFYSGDAHVVMLDVVVPGPGAIADVDVRFKDLVRLGNGRAQSALSLARGAPTRGPREMRVLSSLIAQETAIALADAADRAHAGDLEGARARLASMRDAIDEMRRASPELARDRTLGAEHALCERYLAAVSSGASSDPQLFAASLRYASRRLIAVPQIAAASTE